MKIKKCKPCGESSPYWDWVRDHGYTDSSGSYCESASANPDTLPSNGIIEISKELAAILDVLNEGGELVLSPKEKVAFQLVVREGLSYRKAAKKMGCSFHTVHSYVKRAAVKLRKLCQTKL